jgi:hypothetical protein
MMIGGCPWEIEICYKCGLTYPGEVYILGVSPIPQFPTPCIAVTGQEALDYAYSQLANYDYIRNEICQMLPAMPPCPQQSQTIRVYHSFCWKMTKIIYFGHETIRFSTCEGNSCIEDITYCHNGLTIVKSSTGYMTGPPDCALEEYMVTVPTVVGQSSDCFIYHTPCNP